uniref:Mfa1 family fimbria major subunit n=1 Tax=Prevotella sp. TaxID=59823 RepID=UPI004025F0A1
MKKMNLLVMSLVSAAALSFTSCSSNDDLAGDNAGQAKVDGFYMTLTVQSPKSDGTRTAVSDPENATAEEAAIKNGTLYLVDANGEIAFQENLSGLEWSGEVKDDATKKKDGQKTFKIKVENVKAGQIYNVYFLAGNHKPADDMNFKATNNNFFTAATNSFASPFADDNNFAMFNQNDADVNGKGYSVTFIKANNNEKNPAKVNYKKDGTPTTPNAPIKVERVVARIDAPTSNSTVLADAPTGASPALKLAMKDAKEKVGKIELTNYAISNLANKSYVMQTWNSSSPAALVIPNDKEGFSYIQPTTAFGGEFDYKNGGFNTTETIKKNYVFENSSTTAPTTMYFEYKVTLNNEKFESDADFKDDATNAGTFYRYNNVIYTSFAQIFKDYTGVADLFGTGMDADKMKAELTNVINSETKLAEFRNKYNIEVFKGGKTYYKHVIKDNHINVNGTIQRNSIYRLNIKNIFNVGTQVPNGKTTENEFYYLDVTVTVNPWVLNTEDVDLQ